MAFPNPRHKIENPPRDYIDALRGRLPTATDTEKARLHAEIAERYERRYAWDAEQRRHPASKPHLILQIRLRELERLFARRYGGQLPDDDAGWGDLVITAHTIAGLGGEVEAHIVAWASVWASWVPTARAERLAAHVAANPLRFKADTLGWRLGLTKTERAELQIKTIGAAGVNKEQRAAERKEKRNERDRIRRAEQSAGKPRGRPSNGKPWLAEGVSKATWYRRDKNARPIGNKVIIDTPMLASGFCLTTDTERGTAAGKPATDGTRLPVTPSQDRQRQPQRKNLAKGKTTQAVTPARHQDTSGRSQPIDHAKVRLAQTVSTVPARPAAPSLPIPPSLPMIRLDWTPPANYGRAFDPAHPPAWAIAMRKFAEFAEAAAAGKAPLWVPTVLRLPSRQAA